MAEPECNKDEMKKKDIFIDTACVISTGAVLRKLDCQIRYETNMFKCWWNIVWFLTYFTQPEGGSLKSR